MSTPELHAPLRRAGLPAILAGFASIYFIWGSTYLAIRFVVETMPPFLSAGLRFTTAGAILWLIVRLVQSRRSGTAPPPRSTFAHWRAAAIAGTLMLCGGNGLVYWAEQRVPSGIAALIVGTMPIWMVLFQWLLFRGKVPGASVWFGLLVGFGGVAILAGDHNGGSDPAYWHIGALLLACVFWAYGSLLSRRMDQGPSMLQSSAMQMIGGGASLLVVGSLLGEWARIDISTVPMTSFLALLYLILVGSLVGFTSYIWLLQVASPTAVSTYAYVNPVVAVFLGWWLGNEAITVWTILAGAMVVGAVALMTMVQTQSKTARVSADSASRTPSPSHSTTRLHETGSRT